MEALTLLGIITIVVLASVLIGLLIVLGYAAYVLRFKPSLDDLRDFMNFIKSQQ